MMTIETAPGVTQRMLPTGHLELACRETGRHVDCEPVAAAMWIALSQAGGDIDRASAVLADLWETPAEDVRYDMIALAGSLCSLGMFTEA